MFAARSTIPPPDKELVVSYLVLRRLVGIVGILMPLTVRLGAWVLENIPNTGSISAYYYTGMRDVFVSSLVLVGTFLACYRTPATLDKIAANVAGLAAIGIGVFPMEPEYAPEILAEHVGLETASYCPHGPLGFHFAFVCVFFALASYLVLFSFTNFTPENASDPKRLRNRIYYVCGGVMLASIALIGILKATSPGTSIFWPETTAVVAFSVAWLVKGRTPVILPEKVRAA